MPIQKNIFQTWWTSDLPAGVQSIVDRTIALNPDFIHYLYLDADMDEFVHVNYPGRISEAYDRLNIIVAKVDFWRYLVLYKYGGVYLDMDSAIDKPLAELIRPEDQAIITAEGNPGLYVQWGLIFAQGHPILGRVIDLVVSNIETNRYPNDVHKMTGPTVYTEAIEEMCKTMMPHSSVSVDTDATYKLDEHDWTVRVFSIDYRPFLRFKHEHFYTLYTGKYHWREEVQIKPLLMG